MPVIFKDMTGVPRSNADIEAAIKAIEKKIVQADFAEPEFFLHLSTIREGLKELLAYREAIETAKGTKKDNND